MLGVLRLIEQDHGAGSGRIKDWSKEFGIGVEFFQIAGTKLSESLWLVAEPVPQLAAGCCILDPGVVVESVFATPRGHSRSTRKVGVHVDRGSKSTLSTDGLGAGDPAAERVGNQIPHCRLFAGGDG